MDILKIYYPPQPFNEKQKKAISDDLIIYNNNLDCSDNFSKDWDDTYISKYGFSYKRSPSGYTFAKMFIGPKDSFIYQEFLNEVKMNLLIESFINKGQLDPSAYLQMITYNNCSNLNADYLGYIIYPDLSEFSIYNIGSNKLIRQILSQLTILYQTTGLIHGDFTLDNIYEYYSPNRNIVIRSFGRMRKGTCLDHAYEFIWFIIQIANKLKVFPYKGIVIGPAEIIPMIGLNYLEVQPMIKALSQSQLDNIFNYWLFN